MGKIYVIAAVIGASLAVYMDVTVDGHTNRMIDVGYLSHPLAWGLPALIT